MGATISKLHAPRSDVVAREKRPSRHAEIESSIPLLQEPRVRPGPSKSSTILGRIPRLMQLLTEGQEDRRTDCFRFLDLPSEIRIMIYEEVLVVGKVFYSPDDHDIWNGKRCRGHNLFRKPQLGLLQVCRQIHDEAEPVYLSGNLFVLPTFWFTFAPFHGVHRANNQSQDAERYLFSAAGLEYICNISFSIDQRLYHNTVARMSHRTWKTDELVFDGRPFEQLTGLERFEKVHDLVLNQVSDAWTSVLESLGLFQSTFEYIEVDFTNAFCPLGECRPIGIGAKAWIRTLQPRSLDVVGLQSSQERGDFIFWVFDNEELTHQQLREEHGLRFSNDSSPSPWDSWMVGGNVEGEKEYYVCFPLFKWPYNEGLTAIAT